MSELLSGLHRMKTPRLQLYPQADTTSILLWYGAGSEWRRWKRTVLLCDADSDTPEERRSVRVSRHVLVDKVAERAEAMTDEHIRGSDGVRNIKQFLDSHTRKSPTARTSSAESTDTNGRRQARALRTSQRKGNSSNATRRQ